ncbi:hypothetical protein ACFE04_004026 [Oxalis oulophora]
MLRAKQISNISSSARSFFLNGSKYTPDGSTTVTNEDHETTTTTTTTSTSTTTHHLSKRGGDTSAKVSVVVSSQKVENFNTLNHQKSDSVKYHPLVEIEIENDVSLQITDQFVKAGIATATFFSDIVNYKIPGFDTAAAPGIVTNCVIEQTRPVTSFRSSNVNKPVRTDNFSKVYTKPSAAANAKDKKSNFVGGFKRSSSDAGERNFSATQIVSTDRYEKKRSLPQRSNISKPQSNHFTDRSFKNVESSGSNRQEYVAESFNKPSGVTQFPRQHAGSGRVVESASQILRRFKWCPAAESALVNLNCSIDPFQANQVLKQTQDYNVALEFFYWLKRQPRFKHDEHTYTTMVGILGRAKQFGEINKLLDVMVRDGCRPNVVTYNRLIHSYGRANYLNDAINVFKQMQERGCEPDRVTYCTLIDIHAKAGFLDVAMDMYQRMQAAGLTPDTFTYSVMINCLGKGGHLPAAQKLFFEMIDHGCVPNLVTYNIMIALQAKARNYQSALTIYRDMNNAGFEPDKVTYSIVMEVLGHCGYLDEVEAVFTEMKRNNWVPDEPVYGLLVDLWGKAGNVQKAWQWYQAMLHAGLRPNVPTCNSMLSAFLRVHMLSDAYNLLQNMLVLGLHPSLQTYTLLLSCCTEARSAYDMGCFRELMAISGHPAHMFLLSMPAAGPDGENVRGHVTKFLDLMHSEDRESKRGLIDSVVHFLHKSGLKEEAGSVWEVAARKNVYPDTVKERSSCCWLINLHVMSDGTAVTALCRTLAWLRQQTLVCGISPPNRIDIVTGWGRRSKVAGSSLVRQTVEELLSIFSFPFETENGNSGCFTGCGEPLNRWLLQSYVERMHLL